MWSWLRLRRCPTRLLPMRLSRRSRCNGCPARGGVPCYGACLTDCDVSRCCRKCCRAYCASSERGVLAPTVTLLLGEAPTVFIVMLNATAAEGPSALDAVMLKIAVPAVVGAPDITPLLFNERPAGSMPDDTAQLVGLFVAARVALYAVPTVPFASAPAVVVMTGGIGSGATFTLTGHFVFLTHNS